MSRPLEPPVEAGGVEIPEFPETFASGATVLLAGNVDPSTHALGLRALRQFGHPDDTGVVVTTTEPADRTLETYESIEPPGSRPSVGLVDATSEQQFVSAVYGADPVVFTPGDVERIVMGLTELTGDRVPPGETRHLVVRSLTPLLADTSSEAVGNVVERIAGLRSETGIGLFGLDYTRHDEATLSALAEHVEYLLWVTEERGSVLEFELQPTNRLIATPRSKRGE